MVLNGRQIKEWLLKDWPNKLVVTPSLTPVDEIKDDCASIDVRLGQQFLVTRAVSVSDVDPIREEFALQVGRSQQTVHVSVGNSFMLHPGRFALGATLEYIRLPHGLAAYVIGRSSWARVGLVIAMATAVHPGFAGVLTLELQNLGDVPLALYPGSRVAQLVFHTAAADDEAPAVTSGTYACQTGPGASALENDKEWDILRSIRNRRAPTA